MEWTQVNSVLPSSYLLSCCQNWVSRKVSPGRKGTKLREKIISKLKWSQNLEKEFLLSTEDNHSHSHSFTTVHHCYQRQFLGWFILGLHFGVTRRGCFGTNIFKMRICEGKGTCPLASRKLTEPERKATSDTTSKPGIVPTTLVWEKNSACNTWIQTQSLCFYRAEYNN